MGSLNRGVFLCEARRAWTWAGLLLILLAIPLRSDAAPLGEPPLAPILEQARNEWTSRVAQSQGSAAAARQAQEARTTQALEAALERAGRDGDHYGETVLAATLYHRLGEHDVDAALPMLYRAVKAATPEVTPSLVARLLMDVAYCDGRSRNIARAVDAGERATGMYRKLGDDLAVARMLDLLAFPRFQQGQIARVARGFQEMREIYARLHRPAEAAVAFERLAVLHASYGLAALAVDELREVAETYGRLGMRARQAEVLGLLAITLGTKGGQFQEATQACERGLAIAIADGNLLAEAGGLATQGNLLYWQGLDDQAGATFERALDLLARLEVSITGVGRGAVVAQGAAVKCYLAQVQAKQGRHAEAQALVRQAMETYTTGGRDDLLVSARALLGTLYSRQGRHAEAVIEERQALAMARKRGLATSTPSVMLNLAFSLGELRQYDEAFRLYDEALALLVRDDFPLVLLDARRFYGLHLERVGRRREALVQARLAIDALERVQREAFYASGDTSALSLEAQHEPIYATAARLALLDGQPGLAFTLLEKGRGRLAAVTRLRSTLVASSRESRALVAELRSMESEIAVMHAEARKLTGAVREETVRRIETARRELERKDAELSRLTGTFRIDEVTWKSVAEHLPNDAALVDFATLDDGVHAFVVTRSGLRHLKIQDEKKVEAAARFMERLRREGSLKWIREDARKLHALLLAPLEPHLRGVRRLVMVADGSLRLMAWDALVDRQGRYLVETLSVTVLEAARDLLRPRERHGKGACVFGGCLYSLPPRGSGPPPPGATPGGGPRTGVSPPGVSPPSVPSPGVPSPGLPSPGLPSPSVPSPSVPSPSVPSPGGSRAGGDIPIPGAISRGNDGNAWENLPGTAEEAERVAALLRCQPLMAGDATEAEFKRRAPGIRLLHVATHGYMSAREGAAPGAPAVPGQAAWMAADPLHDCGLVFTGVNVGGDGRDDGDLTAYEVLGLDLSGVELVVLSACETGLGRLRTAQGGEGIFGLRRAFLVAGAESLVLALWKVSDEGTLELMVRFYQGLAKGQAPPQALRAARLALLHGLPSETPARCDTTHPYYWAPFILVGPP